MPIDISRNIDRFESEDLKQFTFANTLTVPRTIDFIVFNTDGTTLAPVDVQSGLTVTVSAATANVGSVGVYYLNRQLPSSVGFYTYWWRAWGSSGGSSGSIAAYPRLPIQDACLSNLHSDGIGRGRRMKNRAPETGDRDREFSHT